MRLTGYHWCLLILTLLGESVRQTGARGKYHIGGFPKIHTHAASCGRLSKHISRQAVCDPANKAGSEEGREKIDLAAIELNNETKCDCLNKTHCRNGGYAIAVMIVSEMDSDKSRDDLLGMAQKNADHLRDYWTIGQCGDDIVVFYSAKEQILATAVGNVTEKKLSRSQIATVQSRVRPHLEKGNITVALVELIRLYKVELQRDSWLLEGWIIALIIVAVLLLLVVLAAAIFYCVKNRRKSAAYDTHSGAKYQPAKSADPDVTADTKLAQSDRV